MGWRRRSSFSKEEESETTDTGIQRNSLWLTLFAAAVLAGSLIVASATPVWPSSRTFVQAPGSPLEAGYKPTTVTNADLGADSVSIRRGSVSGPRSDRTTFNP